jgi:hypothetical protein
MGTAVTAILGTAVIVSAIVLHRLRAQDRRWREEIHLNMREIEKRRAELDTYLPPHLRRQIEKIVGD